MFPKQNCPVCQNRAYNNTSTAITQALRLAEVTASRNRLLEENAKLVYEVESWKKRAEQHGCNITEGDPECG